MAKTRNTEDGWKLPEGTRARIYGLAKISGYMDEGHGPAILFRALFEYGYESLLRRMAALTEHFDEEHKAKYPGLPLPTQETKDMLAFRAAFETMCGELQNLTDNAANEGNRNSEIRNPGETGGP